MELLGKTENSTFVIGHRGAPAYAPENTMASFRKGLECGSDWLECDVHLTQDEHLVVIHDDTLNRTTSGKGKVKKIKLDNLKKLDAGKGEAIPTLKELLSWVISQTHLKLVIEVKSEKKKKSESSKVILEKMDEIFQEFDSFDRAMVISFDHSLIEEIKKLNPRIAVGLLFPFNFKKINEAKLLEKTLKIKADGLWPSFKALTRSLPPHFVDHAHQQNLRVFTWTLNKPQEMVRALKMGVDGICTDVPDILRALINTGKVNTG
jgi:glycerophosphoryl diester phosphodiesterase